MSTGRVADHFQALLTQSELISLAAYVVFKRTGRETAAAYNATFPQVTAPEVA